MIRNYFKTALRHFLRNKLFSIINILGLAIGLACSVLILLWVHNELNYDTFHRNHKTIYRILQDMPFTKKVTWAITQGPLAPGLAERFPEIKRITRVSGAGWRLRFEEEEYYHRGIYADSSFLEIFSFPLIKGDIRNVLSNKYSVILTEKMAESIFGDRDPIGKVIKVYDYFDVEVTGLMKNPDIRSHLQFDFISTMSFAKEIGYSVARWDNSGFITYVQLHPEVSADDVGLKIENFLDDKPTIEEGAKLRLQPLKKIHLGTGIDYDNAVNGSMDYVILFFGSGIFILVIACINFMNLSTGRSMKRIREIGMRKTVGASRKQLMVQFLTETSFLVIISFIIALLTVHGVINLLNHKSDIQFEIEMGNPVYLSGFFFLFILTILMAGFYPAFIFSSVRLNRVLKGTFTGSMGNSRFKKVLVIIQFTTSIFLFIGTLAVYQQVQYLLHRDLGFNQNNLVYILLHQNGEGYFENLKQKLLEYPDIKNVSASASFPTSGFQFTNDLWNWEGKDPDLDVVFRAEYIDYDFFKTFGISMKDGRSFSKDFASDSVAVILNESALDIIDYKDPIGKTIKYNDNQVFTIAGISQDYHFRSLHSEIEPQILLLAQGNLNYAWVRIHPENIPQTLEIMRKEWIKLSPDNEFNYGFLDDNLKDLYEGERAAGMILFIFSVLAIIILSLGLYGLLGFAVTQRNKEISIRKVMGADTLKIIILFSKEYAKLMFIATLITIPSVNYFIVEWLEIFPYRMELNVLLFLLPVLIIFLISFLIIFGQSMKAAWINPAEILRNE